MRSRFAFLVLIIAFVASLRADDVPLAKGLGNLHRPVSTKNALAQRYFDLANAEGDPRYALPSSAATLRFTQPPVRASAHFVLTPS